MNTLFTTGAVALIAVAGLAQAQSFEVTEVYPGISGEDGTNDWFELVNTGAGVLDTGTLFWDDEGPSAASGGQLDSFLLQPGEIAIFVIAPNLTAFEDDSPENAAADVIEQFRNVWGNVANVGITNGGGNLSQNGDTINLSIDGGLTFPFSLTFGNAFANTGATIDNVAGLTDSVVGVNGAYVSNSFYNNNDPFGTGNLSEQETLIGSPGVIPTPGAAGLLGLAGLAAVRRRR